MKCTALQRCNYMHLTRTNILCLILSLGANLHQKKNAPNTSLVNEVMKRKNTYVIPSTIEWVQWWWKNKRRDIYVREREREKITTDNCVVAPEIWKVNVPITIIIIINKTLWWEEERGGEKEDVCLCVCVWKLLRSSIQHFSEHWPLFCQHPIKGKKKKVDTKRDRRERREGRVQFFLLKCVYTKRKESAV
jgi:hypothetical protein